MIKPLTSSSTMLVDNFPGKVGLSNYQVHLPPIRLPDNFHDKLEAGRLNSSTTPGRAIPPVVDYESLYKESSSKLTKLNHLFNTAVDHVNTVAKNCIENKNDVPEVNKMLQSLLSTMDIIKQSASILMDASATSTVLPVTHERVSPLTSPSLDGIGLRHSNMGKTDLPIPNAFGMNPSNSIKRGSFDESFPSSKRQKLSVSSASEESAALAIMEMNASDHSPSVTSVSSDSESGSDYKYEMCRDVRTVFELWDEWYKGLNGKPPIVELESKYGSDWRMKKDMHFFFRRKKIIEGINQLIKENEDTKSVKQILQDAEKLRKTLSNKSRSLNALSNYFQKYLAEKKVDGN
ncbi:BA75_04728T0 [Komagataella pastoris]|uniref:BA75_04728T0 n=1 Tax=Komagataella pastoris TaxID=4922 RepID=A0A1B2JHW3_PICPA|nr:BA75_04728T0 [Komagataella pastoris]